eukprot:CAMPEP_0114505994 /NCGR_PEP_ID=MMETSP0109-20121206/11168_1 /TAXON_ID=29199 /ORGANISM="Chlorarachnion reptans, Strain CCCM449" /LENGTH=84 /DNA_ID=CAMNT_0001684507 /DNA_START=155 /DNA_END=409 /DNA_ORIENTATION=-
MSDKDKMRKWMIFWIVFITWRLLEIFLDFILYYMPLYPEIKMSIIGGLVFGGGAPKIYDPYLQTQIDSLAKMAEKKMKTGARVD